VFYSISMYLQSLSLLNFKNIAEAEMIFSPRINCFVGNNGVGKTNLLDAIHYLCLCKSYFNPIDTQNIRHDQEFAMIQGVFSMKDREDEIMCSIHHNRNKVFKRNKKEYERLAQHIGLYPVVMISPEDSALIMEGSEERRKFLNSVISQYDKGYLEDMIQYNKLLAQRNKVLKDFGSTRRFDEEMLAVYDEQMVPAAARIYNQRIDFTNRMIPIFQHYYHRIAPDKEMVDLHYQSQLLDHDFGLLLKDSRDKDLAMQYTTQGIHKDDLILRLNGHALKKTGSQGQQKTFLVTLKLAQFDFIKEMNKAKPILLLDDVFDKFDESRVRQIIRLVSGDHFGQIFISHTDESKMQSILEDMATDFRLFHVTNGSISD
jgi:DNA replication and repair protein RecF